MAAPSGIIVGWPSTNASIPSGWARVTGADSAYIRAPATGTTTGGGTGGASSHNHTGAAGHTHSVVHNHSIPAAATNSTSFAGVTGGSTVGAVNPHAHGSSTTNNQSVTSSSVTASNASVNNDLDAFLVIWIKANGTTDIPSSAVAWWPANSSSIGSPWSNHSSGNSKYYRGAAAAGDGGGTVTSAAHVHGTSSHTAHTQSTGAHTHTGTGTTGGSTASGTPNGAAGAGGLSIAQDFPSLHTHNVTIASTTASTAPSDNGDATSDNTTHEPNRVKLYAVTSSSQSPTPTGLIAGWDGSKASIPANWNYCDGTLGTPTIHNGSTNDYLKNAASAGDSGRVNADSGGASHQHTASHSHALANTHAHTLSAMTGSNNTGLTNTSGSTQAQDTHTHTGVTTAGNASWTIGSSGSLTYNSADASPLFYDLLFIQFAAPIPRLNTVLQAVNRAGSF